MIVVNPQDNPPSYDSATGSSVPPRPVEVKPIPPRPPPSMPVTSLYHYVNPVTNEHIASLLPPGHPEMICLQMGGHLTETKFGILGVLAAVFWFPIGIGLCLLDRRVKCRRCGIVIQDGICG